MKSKKRSSTETSSFGTSGRSNHDSSKFYQSKLYEDLTTENPVIERNVNHLASQFINSIIHDSSVQMKEIPDNSIHLMVTSPPYNVSKEYDDDLSLDEYLELLEKVFTETHRVLVYGGRACINIANIGRKPYIPLSSYISQIMKRIGFLMRGEIIWNKAASASPSTAWGSWKSASNPMLRDVHEYIMVFSKGDYKRERTTDEKKEKLDTITDEQFLEWTKSVWLMSAESAKRVGHPAPFPIELPFRLIQLYSFKHDIILDPFIGSGTTAIAAIQSNRNYIGYEIDESYIELAKMRIKNSKQKQLELF